MYRIGKTYYGNKIHLAVDTGRVMYWSKCGNELLKTKNGNLKDITCLNCIKLYKLHGNV